MSFKILLLAAFLAVVPAAPSKSKDENSELKDVFRMFDKDWDETLSKDDIKDAIKYLRKVQATEDELNDLIKYFNKNGNNLIKLSEFIEGIKNENDGSDLVKEFRTYTFRIAYNLDQSQIAGFTEIFNTIDEDKNGRISKNEFQETTKSHGLKETTADELFSSFDENEDGSIDFNDFVKKMSKMYVGAEKLRSKLSEAGGRKKEDKLHDNKTNILSVFSRRMINPAKESDLLEAFKIRLFRIAYGLNEAQVKGHFETFRKLDKDLDGRITLKELQEDLKSQGLTESKFNATFSNVDEDNSGSIDLNTFFKIMLKKDNETQGTSGQFKRRIPDQIVTEVLKYGDKDGDGSLSFFEFVKVMSTPSDNPLIEEFKKIIFMNMFNLDNERYSNYEKIFKKYDQDNRGYISKSELRAAVESLGVDNTDFQFDKAMKKENNDTSFMGFLRLNTKTEGGENSKTEFKLSATEKSVFQDTFEDFDENRDGRISMDEFKNVLKSFGMDEFQVNELMMIADLDDDDSLDLNEFLYLMSNEIQYSGAIEFRKHVFMRIYKISIDECREIYKKYKKLDKDGNGGITENELGEAFKEHGQELSDSELDELMRRADEDEDGAIEMDEFFKYVKRHIQCTGRFNLALKITFCIIIYLLLYGLTKALYTHYIAAFNRMYENKGKKASKGKLPELLKTLDKNPKDRNEVEKIPILP